MYVKLKPMKRGCKSPVQNSPTDWPGRTSPHEWARSLARLSWPKPGGFLLLWHMLDREMVSRCMPRCTGALHDQMDQKRAGQDPTVRVDSDHILACPGVYSSIFDGNRCVGSRSSSHGLHMSSTSFRSYFWCFLQLCLDSFSSESMIRSLVTPTSRTERFLGLFCEKPL